VFYMLSQSLKLCEFHNLRILTIDCDLGKRKKYEAFLKHLFRISSNIRQTSNVSEVRITVL